jgi:hypothetical protein
MNLTDFLEKHPEVTVTADRVPKNPFMDDKEWEKPDRYGRKATHWFVMVKCGTRIPCGLYYSQGAAYWGFRRFLGNKSIDGRLVPQYKWKRSDEIDRKTLAGIRAGERGFSYGTEMPIPPVPSRVLECLLTDCQMLDGAPTWPEWADSLGGNVDSIKGKTTYEQVVKQRDELRATFGNLWNEFLSCEGE